MIPLATLDDEYLDWPKLTEQKKRKNPFEYIVPPPTKVGRNKYWVRVKQNFSSSINGFTVYLDLRDEIVKFVAKNFDKGHYPLVYLYTILIARALNSVALTLKL